MGIQFELLRCLWTRVLEVERLYSQRERSKREENSAALVCKDRRRDHNG